MKYYLEANQSMKISGVLDVLFYASTLYQNRGKFESKAVACVFLGYPPGQKGYKLLEISMKRVFVSRDVHFHENHFPFSSSSDSHNPPSFSPLFSPSTSIASEKFPSVSSDLFLSSPITPISDFISSDVSGNSPSSSSP